MALRAGSAVRACAGTGLAVAAWLAFAVTAMADTRTLTGTVSYRERIALPPTAVVEVKLVDVSRADAPSRTIAETSINPAGQVPVRWRLAVDEALIKPGARYALQARITVDGQLLFVTAVRHPIFDGAPGKTDIMVQRVAARSDPKNSPVGRWLAEDIGGGGVIDRLQTILDLAANGAVSGTGGCNRMMGKARIAQDRLTFGPLASTKMACAPAVMAQEQKFFAALRQVRRWRVDPLRRKLTLLDADGKPLIVFARI